MKLSVILFVGMTWLSATTVDASDFCISVNLSHSSICEYFETVKVRNPIINIESSREKITETIRCLVPTNWELNSISKLNHAMHDISVTGNHLHTVFTEYCKKKGSGKTLFIAVKNVFEKYISYDNKKNESRLHDDIWKVLGTNPKSKSNALSKYPMNENIPEIKDFCETKKRGEPCVVSLPELVSKLLSLMDWELGSMYKLNDTTHDISLTDIHLHTEFAEYCGKNGSGKTLFIAVQHVSEKYIYYSNNTNESRLHNDIREALKTKVKSTVNALLEHIINKTISEIKDSGEIKKCDKPCIKSWPYFLFELKSLNMAALIKAMQVAHLSYNFMRLESVQNILQSLDEYKDLADATAKDLKAWS